MRSDHGRRVLSGRMTALVLDRCARHKDVAPTAEAQSETEVYILEIHEESVIKTANGFKRRSPHEDTRATEPPCVALDGIVGGLVVVASPRVGRCEVAQQRVADSEPQRRDSPCRWVDGAILIANPRA